MPHRHADMESHASRPADFPPARFVVQRPSRVDVFVQVGHDAPRQVAGPFDSVALAQAALAAMNVHDEQCQFCNGSAPGASCADCGMPQARRVA